MDVTGEEVRNKVAKATRNAKETRMEKGDSDKLENTKLLHNHFVNFVRRYIDKTKCKNDKLAPPQFNGVAMRIMKNDGTPAANAGISVYRRLTSTAAWTPYKKGITDSYGFFNFGGNEPEDEKGLFVRVKTKNHGSIEGIIWFYYDED